MNRFEANIVLFSSIAIGLGLWLVFDRYFVRPQNQLLHRLDKTEAIEATVVASQGGWQTKAFIAPLVRLVSGAQSGVLSKAARQRLFELPDLVDLLAVSMSSGEGLLAAVERVSAKATGIVANDLKRVVAGVHLGSSLSHELAIWSERANSRHVAELCTKLQLALTRGTPIAELLDDQAQTLRAEVEQIILKKSGQNETRMLIPLVFLILPVTVIFAVYPSLQVLSITY